MFEVVLGVNCRYMDISVWVFLCMDNKVETGGGSIERNDSKAFFSAVKIRKKKR